MHHIIIGNGSINDTELVTTIDSLWEAAESRDDNYWVEWIITAHTKVQAVTRLAEWAEESGLALVLTSDDADYIDTYTNDTVVGRVSKDPYESVFAAPDEERQVLAIIPEDVDDLEQDDMDFIVKSCKYSLKVFDIAHQMVEVKLEADEPSAPAEPSTGVDETVQAEPGEVTDVNGAPMVEATHPITGDIDPEIEALLTPLAAEDFESHTLEELKAQCDSLGLEPDGDKRKKDSYIGPILAHLNKADPPKPLHYADHGVAGGFPHPAEACEPTVSAKIAEAKDEAWQQAVESFHADDAPMPEVAGADMYEPPSNEDITLPPATAILAIYDASGLVRHYPVPIDKAYEILGQG